MAKLGSERYSVQTPLIQYVCEPPAEYLTSDNEKIFLNLGWQYVSSDEALRLRENKTNLIFREVFINQIKKLNPFVTEDIAEDLIKRIERIPARIEGNLQAWEYLRGLKTVFVPSERRERNVRFIDEQIDNNIFHVTDEFTYTNGVKTNRYDVVF